jgi:hypothetical protein
MMLGERGGSQWLLRTVAGSGVFKAGASVVSVSDREYLAAMKSLGLPRPTVDELIFSAAERFSSWWRRITSDDHVDFDHEITPRTAPAPHIQTMSEVADRLELEWVRAAHDRPRNGTQEFILTNEARCAPDERIWVEPGEVLAIDLHLTNPGGADLMDLYLRNRNSIDAGLDAILREAFGDAVDYRFDVVRGSWRFRFVGKCSKPLTVRLGRITKDIGRLFKRYTPKISRGFKVFWKWVVIPACRLSRILDALNILLDPSQAFDQIREQIEKILLDLGFLPPPQGA